MSTMQPLRPAESSPAPSTESSANKRRNTAPETSHLRNSCESCANSKVKCSGRKPVCHRCEKRGFSCEYFAAKKAGRKAASSNNASQPGVDAEQQAQQGALGSEGAYASPRASEPSFQAGASELSDIWRDLGPVDSSLFSDLTTTDSSSSDFMASLMEYPVGMPNAADDLFSSPMNTNHANLAPIPDTSFVDSDMSDLFAFPLPTPRATASTSPAKGVLTAPGSPESKLSSGELPCACLAQSLGLMRRLSELMATANATWSRQGIRDATAIRTVQDIIKQNKICLETAMGWLTCPGRHDGYLLIIMSLAAFKMLELFGTVVPEKPTSQSPPAGACSEMSPPISEPPRQSPAQADSYLIEGRDWARQSAHAVLSELHAVRQLTRSLSTKLQSQGVPFVEGSKDLEPPKAMMQGEDAMRPFSGEVYRQLGVDLDGRVKALSQQIINRLRWF